MTTKNIHEVIKILRMESYTFENPALTKIAERSKDPFKVLVSCILSLRTKDEVTAEASGRLYALAGTPQKMMKLSAKQIEKAIYPVGFYRTKAKRIREICRLLAENHGGKVPDDFDELMKFKGVGRKTANIVMIYGFNKRDYIAVDTHCHRVPNRLGWVHTKTPEQTEEELKKILPKKHWFDFNNLFVRFGQNVCKPIKPHCWECPVSNYCRYYREVYLKKQINIQERK